MPEEPTDHARSILNEEAKMLTQMIAELDKQLPEIEFNRLKLITVRDALLKGIGMKVEQLELPLTETENETNKDLEETIRYYVDTPDAEKVSP